MKKLFSGRHPLTIGSILLLIWSLLEVYFRLDTIWWALSGLMNLCVNEGIPFNRAVGYFDPSMFYLVIFTIVCLIFAILCLVFRNRPKAGYFMMLSATAIGGVGLFRLDLLGTLPVGYLKIIPFALIIIGSVMNIIQFNRRRSAKQAGE